MVIKKYGAIFVLSLVLGVFLLGFISATGSVCPLDENDYDQVVIINQPLVSQQEGGPWNGGLYYKFNSLEISLGSALSSGNYSVTLVGRDNYTNRVFTSQPDESYFISFIKNGVSIANTSSTTDLQDNLAFIQTTEIVENNLYLSNGVDVIQAFHKKYSEIPTPTQNSLIAVCVGIKKIEEEPFCGDQVCNGDESCSSCPEDCGICDTPSIKKSSATTLEFFECVPNWKCSGWGECDNGIMTRKCADTNYCDYKYNKPLESSLCTIQKSLVEDKPNLYLGWFIAGIILLIILLSILINLKG